MAFESNFSDFSRVNVANESGGGSSSYSNQMKYNSEELRNMAMYLRNNADNGLVLDIQNILGNLATAWQGPAADAFVAKVTDMMTKLQKMKTEEYMSMATKLDSSASRLEQTTNNLISGINRF